MACIHAEPPRLPARFSSRQSSLSPRYYLLAASRRRVSLPHSVPQYGQQASDGLVRACFHHRVTDEQYFAGQLLSPIVHAQLAPALRPRWAV